jgi:hypothetical protein
MFSLFSIIPISYRGNVYCSATSYNKINFNFTVLMVEANPESAALVVAGFHLCLEMSLYMPDTSHTPRKLHSCHFLAADRLVCSGGKYVPALQAHRSYRYNPPYIPGIVNIPRTCRFYRFWTATHLYRIAGKDAPPSEACSRRSPFRKGLL